ncbi:hypothetical protein L1049_023563 [Liquidambar formosana]|uniref:Pentatricopeptide repeat-containing protein n=1 Tax=Liquidambar formosana TaxID=63359 RepID=A0AAP0WYW5_LIQFO
MALNLSLSRGFINPSLPSSYSLPAKIRSLDLPTATTFEFPASIFKFLKHFSSSLPLHIDNYYDDNNLPYGFNPDSFYSSLIDNSTHKRHLNQIHAQLLVSRLQYSGFLVTKFVNSSWNVGEIRYARKVFDQFPDPDVFLWNAIIRGYSRHNLFDVALEMYSRMQAAGVSPDCFTFPCVLKACSGLPSVEIGRLVHGQIFRHGFESDVFVQNGLVALSLFDKMEIPDVILWNAMISGYAKNGYADKAVELFQEMVSKNFRTDSITVRSTILACAQVGSLELARWMDDYVNNSSVLLQPLSRKLSDVAPLSLAVKKEEEKGLKRVWRLRNRNSSL